MLNLLKGLGKFLPASGTDLDSDNDPQDLLLGCRWLFLFSDFMDRPRCWKKALKASHLQLSARPIIHEVARQSHQQTSCQLCQAVSEKAKCPHQATAPKGAALWRHSEGPLGNTKMVYVVSPGLTGSC